MKFDYWKSIGSALQKDQDQTYRLIVVQGKLAYPECMAGSAVAEGGQSQSPEMSSRYDKENCYGEFPILVHDSLGR
jgi:hypothetical protein